MKIRSLVFLAALAALISPLAAIAQQGPQGGISPEVRAQMEQARSQAKTAVLNDLSADHRTKVQAVVAQVQGGSLDRRDAGSQIDAILSPSESQAVLAEAQKMHDAMHKAFAGSYGGQQPGAPTDRPRMNRTPDAGRFVIMVLGPPRTY